MDTKRLSVVVLAVVVGGCGGAVDVYRGTLTTTTTTGGVTSTATQNGTAVYVYAGSEANSVVMEMGLHTFTVQKSGDSLTVVSGQTFSSTSAGSTATSTLTGTGSIKEPQMNLDLSGTTSQAHAATTINGTFSWTFSGTRI